jgi:hypothetical protein
MLGNRCPRCLLESALIDVDDQDEGQLGDGAGGPAQPQSRKSRRFGEYELIEEIGRGGMGVVYKARQLSLNRIVAVKMLLSGPFAGTVFVPRFRAEAEAAANLHHPNIVAIHDFGECEGQNYFSMDYVLGRNLAELILESPPSPVSAARYVRTIARAIGYAHAQGILHRDLKPSNIIVDADDQPHITDFGLAKRIALGADMTLSGQAIGSPNYMPPEQATGDRSAIGPASDVFSIGAILYHLLAGRPPFLAESVATTLRQVQEVEPASPRLINPGTSRDLETICLKCLEKDPRRRYPSAEALADDLDRHLRGEPIRTRPVTLLERLWRWCRRNPKLAILGSAAGFLALALATGVPIALVRIDRERKAALRRAAEETRQRQLAESALYRLDVQRARDLFARDRAPEGVAVLAYLLRQNPRDRAVAEWLMNELTYRSIAVPMVEPVRHDGEVVFAQFSGDGQRLLTVSSDNSVRVWNPTTGQPITPPLRHETSLHPDEFHRPDRPLFARFSPDGTRVVTASFDGTARVWDAASGQPATPPLAHGMAVTCAQITPDGTLVVTGGSDGKVRYWDSTTGREIGLTLPFPHQAAITSIEFSRNGKRMITASDDRSASMTETRTGKPVGAFMTHTREVRGAGFSPNGKKAVTFSADFTARVWQTSNGAPVSPPCNTRTS